MLIICENLLFSSIIGVHLSRMLQMGTEELLKERAEYKYGFVTEIETESFPKGLTEETVRAISQKRDEPAFMLDFRLKAFAKWQTMQEPTWANVKYAPIDYQAISYYSAPKKKQSLDSLSEVDPELLKTFERLGIPLDEQKRLANVAVDVVFDSVSLGTTFQKTLREAGVVLCSFSEAVHQYPDLIEKYLGSVVPIGDNYFAALNSAVFTDGSFVYIPKGVRSPIELSTYFRINDRQSGQFERTLIIAEEDSYVSYLEGCTAPSYDTNQLHAAVVELIALTTLKSIFYGAKLVWGRSPDRKRGSIQFCDKTRPLSGTSLKISWTQVEAGSAITWKYPSCILQGDESVGEFYSIALTNGWMQADTGTKMIHLGNNTRSTIISKGISADLLTIPIGGLSKWLLERRERAIIRNAIPCSWATIALPIRFL